MPLRQTARLTLFLLTVLFAVMPAMAVKYVAVVETEIDMKPADAAKIEKSEVRLITDELREKAVNNLPRSKYNIMDAETIMSIGGAVLEECSQENCVVTLGSKIGADYIVRGKLGKFQTLFTLSVTIYETENGFLAGSMEAIRSAKISGLFEKTAPAFAEMFKKFVREQDPAHISAHPPVQTPPPATYRVTANANPANGGSVSLDPYKATYNAGEQITLTATPYDDGYAFTEWSGAVTGTVNPGVITVNGNMELTANFQSVRQTFRLTTAAYPPDGGTVEHYPNKDAYEDGETVTVTATPEIGYTFIGWTGAVESKKRHVTVTMVGDRTLTANFYKTAMAESKPELTGRPYTLTTNIYPPNTGFIIRVPYKNYYAAGEEIKITAAGTEDGWTFANWTGAIESWKNPITVKATAGNDDTLTANFFKTAMTEPKQKLPARTSSDHVDTDAKNVLLVDALPLIFTAAVSGKDYGFFAIGLQYERMLLGKFGLMGRYDYLGVWNYEGEHNQTDGDDDDIIRFIKYRGNVNDWSCNMHSFEIHARCYPDAPFSAIFLDGMLGYYVNTISGYYEYDSNNYNPYYSTGTYDYIEGGVSIGGRTRFGKRQRLDNGFTLEISVGWIFAFNNHYRYKYWYIDVYNLPVLGGGSGPRVVSALGWRF